MSAVYSCPHLGCDFVIGAVGPQDPDEPDYFTEDVEAHKRSHADDDGTESEAIAEVQVPHPGDIDEGPLVRSSSQAGLASLITSDGAVTQPNPAPSDAATPSLVVLDAREAALDAAEAAVLDAAETWADMWGDATAPVSEPEHALVAAVRDYRAVIGR